MSNESMASPSPLRLKPRLRLPAESVAATAGGPTASAPTPGPETPPPPIRFQPRAPATPPANGGVTPAVVAAEVAAPAVIGEPPKFKFKIKAVAPGAAFDAPPAPGVDEPGAQLIGALLPPPPMVFPPSEEPAVPFAPAVDEGGRRPALPPFPVIAGPGLSRTNPAVPVLHLKIKGESLPEIETFEDREAGRKGLRRLMWLAGLAVLGAAGYFGWPYLRPQVERFLPAKTAAGALHTTSETLNKIAHAPAVAIDKAQEAIAARRASGQTRVDAAATGEDAPEKPAGGSVSFASKPKPAAPPPPATMAPVSPGLAASFSMEAGPEASSEFRSFVATARVSGVFQGAPARAMINGKLVRAGETVEPALGVIFDGLDTEKKQLVLRDRSGAIISRRY